MGPKVESFVREILASAPPARPISLRKLEKKLDAIAQRDYSKRLKDHFSSDDLRSLLAAFNVTLPALNHKVFHATELPDLARIASGMGARLKASPLPGPGRGLRGYYLSDNNELVKTPVICVNTAHNRVAIAAAFWHEVGHHLTWRIVDSRDRARFSFGHDFDDHLDDPGELLADMVSVLAGYPRPAAKRLFAASLRSGMPPSTRSIMSTAVGHLRSVSGWKFEKRFSTSENLRYLAGMIHFAKLRWVLLSEYGI